ncbi:MAG: hypothetical protein C4339_05345 [Nitrososphaerota archaeon]
MKLQQEVEAPFAVAQQGMAEGRGGHFVLIRAGGRELGAGLQGGGKRVGQGQAYGPAKERAHRFRYALRAAGQQRAIHVIHERQRGAQREVAPEQADLLRRIRLQLGQPKRLLEAL